MVGNRLQENLSRSWIQGPAPPPPTSKCASDDPPVDSQNGFPPPQSAPDQCVGNIYVKLQFDKKSGYIKVQNNYTIKFAKLFTPVDLQSDPHFNHF